MNWSPNKKSYSHVKRGVFLSDLHLFSPRSVGSDIEDRLATYQRGDQCIVLGGDIFDFRWSQLGGLDQTVDAACTWLAWLAARTGESEIIFLPGNHDCHPRFLAKLDDLALTEPRFSWHEHYVQLGDCLFLHGDILDAGLDESRLADYRQQFHHEGEQHEVLHRSYDLAVALRIHKIIPRIRHRPIQTCMKLSRVLDQFNLVSPEAVRRVYFGHTHLPILGLEHLGRQFFNPGAALKQMTYHAPEFTLNGQIE